MLDRIFARAARRAALCISLAFLAACGGGGGEAPAGTPPGASKILITQEPVGQTTDIDKAVTFSVAVQDATGITYQWLRNGEPVPGATQATYTIASAKPTDANTMWAVEVSRELVTKVVTPAVRLSVRPAPGMGLSVFPTGFPDTTRVLAVDSAGNLYVRSNGKPYTADGRTLLRVNIRKFAPDGQALAFGPAGTAGIDVAQDVTAAAMDAADNLYLAHTRFEAILPVTSVAPKGTATASEIQVIDPSGKSTVVFKSQRGDADFIAPVTLATQGTATLYLGDAVSGRILKRSADGSLATLGSADFDPRVAGFPSPNQLAVDAAGQVYLASRTERVISRLNADGTTTVIAGQAGAARAAKDGAGTGAVFMEPTSPVVDAAGNVYVADVNAVRQITPAGVVSTVGLPPAIQTLIALPLIDNLRMGKDGAYYVGWGTQLLKGRAP